ncbi:hypothetical protein ACF0H5_000031 [Mactra antiquata]
MFLPSCSSHTVCIHYNAGFTSTLPSVGTPNHSSSCYFPNCVFVSNPTQSSSQNKISSNSCNTISSQDATIDDSLHSDNLRIGSLNVCGLKRRYKYPEFVSFVNQFDILCLSETKVDQYDVFDIPN